MPSKLHIGKSSAGWCFSLHIIPEKGINNLEDWKNLWDKPNHYINNEYGEIISPRDMQDIIEIRKGKMPFDSRDWYSYRNEDNFHERNYSERGPNNLLRQKIGRYCQSHGNGTWDNILGDFS
jgi:hypothetical protein